MSTTLPGAAQLNTDLAEALREDRFESLALLDVDRFQQLNAELGQATGDRLLGIVHGLIQAWPAGAYQIGGDEFAVLNASPERVAELRSAFQQQAAEEVHDGLTLSGGGVAVDQELLVSSDETVRVLYGAVSQLLSLAKQRGRDQVLWIGGPDTYIAELDTVAGQLFRDLARVNASRARQMEIESRIDPLTGLYNRRGFDDIFSHMVEVAQRTARPLSLIYMDSDTLKKINDEHGHEAGDRFIVDLASVLRSVARRSDFIFRWGADEFAVVLDSGDSSQAVALGERLRSEIATRTAGTISAGIFCGVPRDMADAVRAADTAMYAAKEQGKNRVVVGQA